MIEQDNYFKYDDVGHYYYLTELGLTTYTDVEEGMYDVKRIKRLGRIIHQRMVTSRYNSKPKGTNHRELIDYKVFKNEYNERQAVLEANINFAELMDLNDHDLDVINGMELNTNIIQPLRNANVWFKGEIIGVVPLEELYNGY